MTTKSGTTTSHTVCELSSADARWMAVALLYGPPAFNKVVNGFSYGSRPHVRFLLNLQFRIAVEKFFHKEEIERVGWQRLMHDYKEWYDNQSHSV
jgi:hypothetical protein